MKYAAKFKSVVELVGKAELSFVEDNVLGYTQIDSEEPW